MRFPELFIPRHSEKGSVLYKICFICLEFETTLNIDEVDGAAVACMGNRCIRATNDLPKTDGVVNPLLTQCSPGN